MIHKVSLLPLGRKRKEKTKPKNNNCSAVNSGPVHWKWKLGSKNATASSETRALRIPNTMYLGVAKIDWYHFSHTNLLQQKQNTVHCKREKTNLFLYKNNNKKKKACLTCIQTNILFPPKHSCDLEEWPWSLKLYECIKINTCYHTVSFVSNSIRERKEKKKKKPHLNLQALAKFTQVTSFFLPFCVCTQYSHSEYIRLIQSITCMIISIQVTKIALKWFFWFFKLSAFELNLFNTSVTSMFLQGHQACASVKLSRAYPVNIWKTSNKQYCRESATVNCLHLV